MITNIKFLKRYCKDYTQIENYAEAVKSQLRYDCHHKREIIENKSRKDLIAENLYYGRHPEELIFLEQKEHRRLHLQGKHLSQEVRQKQSESHKGQRRSPKTKQRLSEALTGEKNPMFGKHPSTETLQKMSYAKKGEKNPQFGKTGPWKGKHWHLENGKHVYTE